MVILALVACSKQPAASIGIGVHGAAVELEREIAAAERQLLPVQTGKFRLKLDFAITN